MRRDSAGMVIQPREHATRIVRYFVSGRQTLLMLVVVRPRDRRTEINSALAHVIYIHVHVLGLLSS